MGTGEGVLKYNIPLLEDSDTQTVEPDIDYAGDEAIEIPTTTEDDITLAGDVQICPDYTVEDDLTDDDTNTLGGQGLGDGTVSTGDT